MSIIQKFFERIAQKRRLKKKPIGKPAKPKPKFRTGDYVKEIAKGGNYGRIMYDPIDYIAKFGKDALEYMWDEDTNEWRYIFEYPTGANIGDDVNMNDYSVAESEIQFITKAEYEEALDVARLDQSMRGKPNPDDWDKMFGG